MCACVCVCVYMIWCWKQSTKIKKCVDYSATEPLLLQQGLCMLLVFPPPGKQFSLHGIHVLLDVVHDLAQR